MGVERRSNRSRIVETAALAVIYSGWSMNCRRCISLLRPNNLPCCWSC